MAANTPAISLNTLEEIDNNNLLFLLANQITSEHIRDTLKNNNILFSHKLITLFRQDNLVLYDCGISDSNIETIAKLINKNKHITKLAIEHSNITDEGINILLKNLDPEKYTQLCLLFNQNTIKCFKELSYWVNKSTLTHLQIRDPNYCHHFHLEAIKKYNSIEVDKYEYEELKAIKEKYDVLVNNISNLTVGL